ncbi:MAG: uracil-DNA glycosylase [Chloroflexi bacterium]|nr:uracil-DNA glycosylase [Chloroflexota bacterium]
MFGEGQSAARLAIIGEAPGQQEAESGRPFVGRAGQLLRRTLAEAGIPLDQVWISNVVKCRPTAVQAGRVANRAPTTLEASLWTPWLIKELDILRPPLVLALGNLAAGVLIHKGFKMTEERGRWFPGPFASAVLATYHPSYVLRQTGPQGAIVRQRFRADLAAVAARLKPGPERYPA